MNGGHGVVEMGDNHLVCTVANTTPIQNAWAWGTVPTADPGHRLLEHRIKVRLCENEKERKHSAVFKRIDLYEA